MSVSLHRFDGRHGPYQGVVRRACRKIHPPSSYPGHCALALGGWLIWRQLQGPELPAYRLEARPLVQRVVASGEVDSQSLAQVGSEITGVVAARHVQGDAVNAGDLLLELRDDEQRARLPSGRSAQQPPCARHSTTGTGHPRAAAPRNAVRAQAAGFRAAGAGARARS